MMIAFSLLILLLLGGIVLTLVGGGSSLSERPSREAPSRGDRRTTLRQTERPLVSTPLLRDTSALRCTPSRCISADWRNLETEHTIPELTSELCAPNSDE